MPKTVVIVGALDTKGKEFTFIKDLIQKQGLSTLVIDVGVLGDPDLQPDISREKVAEAGGGNLDYFASGEHKDEAMKTMATGLEAVVLDLYEQGRLDGIFSMGGAGGTSLAARAMRALPIGVPKVIVSTVGGGDVSVYAGTKDIIFIPSIVDAAGINRISGTMYTNAVGAISGMVKMEQPDAVQERPLVTASMFGNTTKCVDHAREILEANDFEVLVFQATGNDGRTMESLILDGYISGSMDITMTELADEVCGGVFSAGPERGMAASKAGIPAVLVPGCVDMANFWGIDTVPEKYKDRQLYEWNPNMTLMRTSEAENTRIGEMIAAAANASTAPVAVLLPLKGVSMLDSPGGEFWDPQADRACFEAIKSNLKPGVPVFELDLNINDPEFARSVAENLLGMLEKIQKVGGGG